MENLKCIYSYFITLLNTWVEWNEGVLSHKASNNVRTFTELMGKDTSDSRTRAKEMYRCGFLKKELIKSGIENLKCDKNIQSDLGYLAAVIFKGFEKGQHCKKIIRALSAVASVSTLLLSVKISDNIELSLNTILTILNQKYHKPEQIDQVKWNRYILSAFLCEINSEDNANLQNICDYFEGKRDNLTLRIISQTDANTKNIEKRVIASFSTSEDVCTAINQKVSLNNIVNQKSALFIIGNPTNEMPKAIYSLANLKFSKFLRDSAIFEKGYIGKKNPFLCLYEDNADSPSSKKTNSLYELNKIFSHNKELENEYNIVMKSMVVGAYEALDKLSGGMSNLNETGQQVKQIIYFGAPGTGKSNAIKELTGNGTFAKNFTFRTTFHPDSDYSSFVGAYKPVEEGGKIIYKFRPQTFLKAYIAAWTHSNENVALIVEEINRGNCAQIFGDIFQLLDREDNGLSKYPIEADIDMKSYLCSAFSGKENDPWIGTFDEGGKNDIDLYYKDHYDEAFDKIKKGEILTLPKNLSILATMNTSDQSLFPMDSAFKRRWEWIYQPIVEGTDKNRNKLGWKIKLDDKHEIDWWEFLKSINKEIADLTTSEDKQLGYFFCMPDEKANPEDEKNTIISAKRFVGKVIFYLWNDVFKAYGYDTNCCKTDNSEIVYYEQFYDEEYTRKTTDEKVVNIAVLEHFFNTLKDGNDNPLMPKEESQEINNPAEGDNVPNTDTAADEQSETE